LGAVLGLDRFGASAPAKDVFRDCGITVDRIVEMAKEIIYSAAGSRKNLKKIES
jgi:transketolase